MKIARSICWPLDSTLRPTIKRGFDIIPICAGIDIIYQKQEGRIHLQLMFVQ